ncbi:MAG: EFR1 family ferrodoxin [Candidatus Omnitrophica bacterium]|nr:EFR1 family ferrodoxin [Candidatus Omnitrophota bacterium]
MKVARDLADELGDTQIIAIAGAIDRDINVTSECIGIIYPVYMFGMPLIVSRFIKKMKGGEDKYIFAIATCGGMAANALGQTYRECKRSGIKLSAGFIIPMPGNYTPLYEAIPADKQNALFEKEKKKIKNIVGIIRRKQSHPIEHNSRLTNWLFSGIYKLGSSQIRSADKNFWADEQCNSCGICVKVCPVRNIELISGKPKWLNRCEQCFACLQWCPQEAIQYKKSTIGRKRYRHPEVALDDLCVKSDF